MKNTILLLLLSMMSNISCNDPSNSINSFFDELERKIENKEKIQEFKDAPRGAVVNYSANFTEEYNELYQNPHYKLIVDDFLNKIEISHDRITGEQTLIIAFQARLNKQKINIKKIANEVYDYNDKLRNH